MNFRFHRLARQEYREAVLYYGERGRGLAEQFTVRLEQAIASMRRFPRSRRVLDRSGARQALLQQFPYALIYVVEAASVGNESIVVYAVAHTKRQPGYWRERLSGN